MDSRVLRKLNYRQDGFYSFDLSSTVVDYCGHEGPSWIARAKKNLGPDWFYHDAPPIKYTIDKFGFRNTKEIEEISEDPNWFLFDVGCFSLGPGLHDEDIMSEQFTRITGFPTYNLSVIGSLTYTTNYNILRLAREWKNPPRGIVTWLTTTPYNTSYCRDGESIQGGQGGQIMTLNHISASLMKQNPIVKKWADYLDSGIAEFQYLTLYENQVNFSKAIGTKHYWVSGNKKENHFPEHFIWRLENLAHRENIPTVWQDTSMGLPMMVNPYNSTYEEQCESHDRHFLHAMKTATPRPDADVNSFGRDLVHPGKQTHLEVAEKLSQMVL